MRHLGDITKISGYTAPIVDCIIGGSPCQDLSVAGKRAGLDGERSGLYMEQIRIVKEMREKDERNGRSGVDIRPRYMVWENVPGAFSSNKGEDFRIVLEELAKVADKDAVVPMPEKWTNYGCIMGDGWSIAWRVLDAQFWGVPQRRRRIALVADFGGQSAPEVLFVRSCVSGHTEPSESKRKATPSDASRGVGADDRLGSDQYNAVILGDTVSTLGVNCGMSHGRQCVLEPLTFEPGIASREGGHIYEGVSGTLRAHAGDNQMATAYSVENHPNDSRVGINEDGIVQALTQRMGTGGGNVPMVLALDRASFNQGKNASYDFEVSDKGVNSPIVAKGPGAVAYCIGNGQAHDAQRPDKELCKTLNCMDDPMKVCIVGTRYIVRRLTPLECERLQGYPDGWTDIGEYIDSNGKKRQTSDAARYKALGNSIALPPWKWVLKRICACYERDATMASLFDGIGGFPYLWEQLNGKGSCLWASEIEEFPMAVTKVRIGE
jgi:DNA (cytosine-5)-methyltransferase 1